jgi:hypothetical protein
MYMSLTTTAAVSRKLIKYGGGMILFVGFGVVILLGAIRAYRAAHPPYLPPTTRYGRLPKIVFPEKKFETKNFTLQLPNEVFPKFADQAKVYIIYQPIKDFLALEYYSKIASGLGFKDKGAEVGVGIYEFKDSNNRTLTINVLNGNFRLSYPYQNDQMLLDPEKVPSKEEAINMAKAFLTSGDRFGKDLEEGEKKVSYWKIEYDGLKSVPAQSEANVARVDFYRKNIEGETKMVTAETNRAAVSVLVSGATVAGKQIIEVDYKYANVDRESFETYPIKTIEKAWEEMKAGKYWPAFDAVKAEVIIRKVSLGYFEPVIATNFLQPVFVFEGDGGFTAYVPAITDEWIGK